MLTGFQPKVTIPSAQYLRHRDAHTELTLPVGKIHCAVSVTKGRGSIITGAVGPFNNTVVDIGLDDLADSLFSSISTYCHCGIGTSLPATGNTALENFFAATNTIQDSVSDINAIPPYFSRRIITYRFTAGTFDGDQSITEVAISDQATTGGIFARALVRDPQNDFAIVSPLTDEWLDVTYEFRLYPDHINADGTPNDLTGVINVWGSNHNFWMRPAFVSNIVYWNANAARAQWIALSGSWAAFFASTSVLGAVTGEPTNPSGADATSNGSEIYHATYIPGDHARNIQLSIGSTDGNASGGIGAMRFHTGFGAYQIRFAPAIPKDVTKSWTFVVALNWADAGLN